MEMSAALRRSFFLQFAREDVEVLSLQNCNGNLNKLLHLYSRR
jgi:hypothetical protein